VLIAAFLSIVFGALLVYGTKIKPKRKETAALRDAEAQEAVLVSSSER
jgi:hypothetical protein